MADARGFSGLYRSDHFTMPDPPDEDSLECIVSLAYLADHSSRVRFGPLVASLSFRDPVLLARQAAALDDLSGGRMIVGVGTGWLEREHSLFGYELDNLDLSLRPCPIHRSAWNKNSRKFKFVSNGVLGSSPRGCGTPQRKEGDVVLLLPALQARRIGVAPTGARYEVDGEGELTLRLDLNLDGGIMNLTSTRL